MSRSDKNATAEGESTAKTLLVRAVNVPYICRLLESEQDSVMMQYHPGQMSASRRVPEIRRRRLEVDWDGRVHGVFVGESYRDRCRNSEVRDDNTQTICNKTLN